MKTLLALLVLAPAEPIKWAPEKIDCPSCGTTSTFMALLSYGSYVNAMPSRWQNLFFPSTAEKSWYSCPNCRLTAHMGDFQGTPKDKLEAIREALKDVKLDAAETYEKVPMVQRLAAAEMVYGVLGRDEKFWCWFQRLVGFFSEAEGKLETAKSARLKALEIAGALLKKPENAGIAKDLWFTSGAMRYYTGDPGGARKDFEEGLKTTFADGEAERAARVDKGLSSILQEFIESIDAKRRPDAPK